MRHAAGRSEAGLRSRVVERCSSIFELRSVRGLSAAFCVLLVALARGGLLAETPSFRHEIVPILSKAGCNGGGCHGALAGKGGFRLSLFGYDPMADHRAITRDSRGRRVELSDPGRSLFLTKPTTAVRHKGGLRLAVDSDDYRRIARWLSAGAPPPREDDPTLVALRVSPSETTVEAGAKLSLRVEAEYSDGAVRDVTSWARFASTSATVADVSDDGEVEVVGPGEGAVTAWFSSRIVIARITSPYPRQDAAAGALDPEAFRRASRANFIDDLVLAQLERLRLPPSSPADATTLVRRVYLDTLGRLPRPEETRAFLSDEAPDRYEALVDRLLEREEFIDLWTYKLSDIFLVSGAKLRPDAVKAYHGWIRSRVAERTPWDELVREVVTARGSSLEQGATNFYAVHQDPESMAENVSQAFLSLSINCARCHNHPLEKWTNDQYYAFANLFARVRAKGWGGDPRNGDGERTIFVEPRGDLIQPRTGRPQVPAPLDAPPIPPDDPGDRREALALWLTAPENPYFSRSIANRVWAHFLGVGLVEPVDDLRVSNPASNEALLAALAEHVVEARFDLRALVRTILRSHTYRRSSEARDGNAADQRNYARFYPRRLMAEVLADAIADVTGRPEIYSELANKDGSTTKTDFYPEGTRALELFDSAVKSGFLATFGRNDREITCECERSNQPSLVQALHLSNGSTINEKLAHEKSRVTELLARDLSPSALLDEIWMLCLCRAPTDREREAVLALLEGEREGAAGSPPREVVEDIFWSLLTSREFLFQH